MALCRIGCCSSSVMVDFAVFVGPQEKEKRRNNMMR